MNELIIFKMHYLTTIDNIIRSKKKKKMYIKKKHIVIKQIHFTLCSGYKIKINSFYSISNCISILSPKFLYFG